MNLPGKEQLNLWFESAGVAAMVFFTMVFPFSPRLCVTGILFYFLTLIFGKKRKPVPLKSVPLALWASMAFYLLHVVSLFYSDNISYGLRDLEIKMGLFLFPLASILIPRTGREIQLFTKIFIVAACLSIFVCLIHSVILYSETKDINSFYYDSFSFLMHPTYYTILLNMSLLLLLYSDNFQFYEGIKRFYNLYYAVFLLMLLAVVLASSRAGLVISLFTCCIYILYEYRKYVRKCLTNLIVLFIGTGFFFSMVIISNPESRFGILLNETFGVRQAPAFIDQTKVDVNPLSHRMQLWETAWNLCRIYPFGTGSGDILDVLVKEYTRTGFEKARIVRYNPHNQFLQSWLAIGIPGLILLLLIFIGNTKGWTGKQNIYYFLALILALNGLFESVFEVQRGVILFSFIIMFFGIYDGNKGTLEFEKQ